MKPEYLAKAREYQEKYERFYLKFQRFQDMDALKSAIEMQINLAELYTGAEREHHSARAAALLDQYEGLKAAMEAKKPKETESVGRGNAPKEELTKTGKESQGMNPIAEGVQVMECPEITFDDIAGMERVKQQLKQVTQSDDPHAAAYKHFNVKLPRTFLFYGPPGTGKTMLGMAFANWVMKGKERSPFFLVESQSLVSCYVGETAKAISALFEEARKYPRSVIFMDDADTFLRSRKKLEKQDEIRNITAILTAMDGFLSKSDETIVICSTNHPEDMDDAVLSRFKEWVEVPLPDAEARRAMLEKHLAAADLSHISLEELVMRSENFNGRDISKFCNALLKNFCDKLPAGMEPPYPPIDRQSLEETFAQVFSSVDQEQVLRLQEWIEDFRNQH